LSVYLDASVVVSLFIRDEMTERARSALRTHLGLVTVSDWTLAETVSAIARAVRTRVLDREAAQHALAGIDLWVVRAADRVEVLSTDIREAELIIRSLETTLKAPDALHIVVARRMGLPLLSFDAAMAREAAALGIEVAAP
jgi:predicted nucleic acid-binding protein